MKISSSLLNTMLMVFGIALTVVLTQAGCQTDTKKVENHTETEDHSGHSHENNEEGAKQPPFMRVEDAQLPEGANLDKVVEEAIVNIEKGKAENDMMLVMNEGIMKLRAVLDVDPDHEQATYQLGLMSIESGQLEKAEKRFEKLLLLQPENQEYKTTLADIRQKLGK